MQLIYSYSTFLGRYSNENTNDRFSDVHILNFYKVSMKFAKNLGHEIKFYGCRRALKYLDGYYDTWVDITDNKFTLVDELKLYIHRVEPIGCVTFDGDIWLQKPLVLDNEADVCFEYRDGKKYYENYYYSIIKKHFSKYPIESKVPHYKLSTPYACNVGIIRFKNEKVRDLFLDSFDIMKDYYLKNIEPKENLIKKFFKADVIVCQHNFASVVEYNNLNVKYVRSSNSYKHYTGASKLHVNPTTYLLEEKEKNNKLI